MTIMVSLYIVLFSVQVKANPQVDCLARMAYFEARGETAQGRKAVMDVMLNRIAHSEFPKSVCANLKPSQYQWVKKKPKITNWKVYHQIQQEADATYAKFLLGDRRDITKGSYFFSSNGRKPAARAFKTVKVGGHQFYGLRPLRRL